MKVFLVLLIGFFVFSAIMGARLLFSLYALSMGAQPITVGMLSGTFSTFPMLFSVLAGKIADRYGSRWPVLVAVIGGPLGMLLPYFFPGLPALFAAAAVNGLTFSFLGVSLQNDVGVLSESGKQAQNFSNFSLMGSIVNLAGPMLTGYAVDHAGAVDTCLYIALWGIIPLIMVLVWGKVFPAGRSKSATAKSSMLKSLSDPGIWPVLVTSSLVISAVDLFQFYMPVYGHSLNLPASAIGLFLGMFAISGVIVRLVLKRLLTRYSVEFLLTYAFFVGAASFVLVPFFKGVVSLSIISFIFGLGIGCSNPIITMLMFSRSAEGRSGEGLGLRMTINHMTRAIGPVIFGSIGSAFGLFAVFWLSALMQGSGGLVSRPKKK
jgi:predicted MFS family arabinose efflux permease